MLSDPDNRQGLQQWIVSLAITVVCCAVFFLVFAGHFLDLHKEVTAARVEAGMLEARLNHLESHVMWERRRQESAVPLGDSSPPVQVNMDAPAAGAVPAVAVPVVGKDAGSAPSVPLNVPHEFNPDEPVGTDNATPFTAPVKP